VVLGAGSAEADAVLGAVPAAAVVQERTVPGSCRNPLAALALAFFQFAEHVVEALDQIPCFGMITASRGGNDRGSNNSRFPIKTRLDTIVHHL
jgi:hypothetical protein